MGQNASVRRKNLERQKKARDNRSKSTAYLGQPTRVDRIAADARLSDAYEMAG